ncbi:MAG: hypothetical protein OCD02_17920 [Spirochaetaceae bacterium]
MKVTIDKIKGFNNRDIEVILNDSNSSECLYVLYPGIGYAYDSPLFYYLTRLLIQNKQNFIFFKLNCDELGKTRNCSYEEFLPHLESEILSSFKYIESKKYKKINIIGKSIGTLAIEMAKNSGIKSLISKYIWLTPF